MIEFDENKNLAAKVKIIGDWRRGKQCHQYDDFHQLSGVDFIAANTDAQALAANLAPDQTPIGLHA